MIPVRIKTRTDEEKKLIEIEVSATWRAQHCMVLDLRNEPNYDQIESASKRRVKAHLLHSIFEEQLDAVDRWVTKLADDIAPFVIYAGGSTLADLVREMCKAQNSWTDPETMTKEAG